MSTGGNPFDITKGTNVPNPLATAGAEKKKVKYTGKKKYTKKDYSKEQIQGLLSGYIEVSKELWADIPINSHIRYFKKDGTFVRGGFVTSHWLNKEGKPFIHLANSFKKRSEGYATWPMAHESVEKIFKKPDAKSGIEMDVVRGKTAEIIGQINKLVDIVKAQKNRIDSHEVDLKKLYAVVKHLAAKK
jgi:hypothetical protein